MYPTPNGSDLEKHVIDDHRKFHQKYFITSNDTPKEQKADPQADDSTSNSTAKISSDFNARLPAIGFIIKMHTE